MEKRLKLWIMILITMSLIYLGLTNRYVIHTVGNGVVVKQDKWTGKIQMSPGLSGFQYIEDLKGQKSPN